MSALIKKDPSGIRVNLLLFISVFGITAFLLVASLASFKSPVFQLFSKAPSFATEDDLTPKVDLKVSFGGVTTDGVVNVSVGEALVTLTWSVSGSPTKCLARSWGLTDTDEAWVGPKEGNGTFTLSSLDRANPYVYTLECSNEAGDGDGDSVTVNVGAQKNTLAPYITSLQAQVAGKAVDTGNPISASVGDEVTISWDSINTATLYSICISTGSWPKGYKDLKAVERTEKFTLETPRIYKYGLYCSNEYQQTKKVVTFSVR